VIVLPLDVVLVGCGPAVSLQVQRELPALGARLEATFADVPAPGRLPGPGERIRVFVVHLDSAAALERPRQLGAAFAGQPVLGLVDAGLEPAVLFGAMRTGAVQLVPLPLKAADFKAALECIAGLFGHAAAPSRVIAVSGVTGGCGATTLAVNLAHEVAHLNAAPTTLCELALHMGAVAPYLDLEPRYTTMDLLPDMARVDTDLVRKVLTPVNEHLSILPGPYRAITSQPVRLDDVFRLIDHLKALARVVVLDVPCTYEPLHFKVLAAADRAVLVAEQTVASVRGLKMVRDILRREEGVRNEAVVINRYNPRTPGFGLAQLGKLLDVAEPLAVVADPAVVESVNHGRPLRLEAPRSAALGDVGTLARRLAGTAEPAPAPAPADRPTGLSRLVRVFKA
jgi:pilus assembly protein CpaE